RFPVRRRRALDCRQTAVTLKGCSASRSQQGAPRRSCMLAGSRESFPRSKNRGSAITPEVDHQFLTRRRCRAPAHTRWRSRAHARYPATDTHSGCASRPLKSAARGRGPVVQTSFAENDRLTNLRHRCECKVQEAGEGAPATDNKDRGESDLTLLPAQGHSWWLK